MPADDAAARWTDRIEAALESSLPTTDTNPSRLHAAMRHAVLGGGKRIRARLVYAAGELVSADDAVLDAAAVAIELIHAY